MGRRTPDAGPAAATLCSKGQTDRFTMSTTHRNWKPHAAKAACEPIRLCGFESYSPRVVRCWRLTSREIPSRFCATRDICEKLRNGLSGVGWFLKRTAGMDGSVDIRKRLPRLGCPPNARAPLKQQSAIGDEITVGEPRSHPRPGRDSSNRRDITVVISQNAVWDP